jgi:hypothetical protein
MMSIAAAYAWPDFQPVVRTVVELDRSVLAGYVGTYQLAPDFSLVFTLEGGQLMAQVTNQLKLPIFPESETKFFYKAVDAEVEFFSDSAGHIEYVVLHQNGRDHRGVKK